MPSLKRLFGSPFGSYKKQKDRSGSSGTSLRKRKSKTASSVQVPSPITITSSTSEERGHNLSKQDSSSLVTRDTFVFDAHVHDDDDDDDDCDDFRSAVLAATSVDTRGEEEANEDEKRTEWCYANIDDVDDDDDFRTTVFESTSSDDACPDEKKDSDFAGIGVDDEMNDFRKTTTTASALASKDDESVDDDDEARGSIEEEVDADAASDVRVYSDDDEDDDDFQTTVLEVFGTTLSVSDSVSDSKDTRSEDGTSDGNDHPTGIDRRCEIDEEDFRTTILQSLSPSQDESNGHDDDIDCKCPLDIDGDDGENYEKLLLARASGTIESDESSSAKNGAESHEDKESDTRLDDDHLQIADRVSISKLEKPDLKRVESDFDIDKLCLNLGVENESDNESPIESIVFGKDVENETKKRPKSINKTISASYMVYASDDSDDDGLVDFDDFRSTISGLTEATNYAKNIIVPPSPSNSTSDASTKKLENFLKTETEAIRKLLSTVESGDDESTVVEESNRGANEAERMAREMEQEMELLIQGNQSLLPDASSRNDSVKEEDANPNDQFCFDSPRVDPTQATVYRPPKDSPNSDDYLTDIRSVIHPTSDYSVDISRNFDNKSISSSPYSPRSHRCGRSISSPSSRNLFRKRPSLYKLKQKRSQKKMNRKKLRRLVKRTLRALLITLIVCFVAFVANWQWNFPDRDFGSAANATASQLKHHTHIDPKKREEVIKLARSYMGTQMENCVEKANSAKTMIVEILPTTELEHAKRHVFEGLSRTSSAVVHKAKHYAPIIAQQSKEHLSKGVKATNAFVLDKLDTHVWGPDAKRNVAEGLRNTQVFVQDRLEYAFTDRAVREQQLHEEERLQRLMKAAAAAAAREAAEKQEQLWTQTMVAGACAFLGSVATNYIWSAL